MRRHSQMMLLGTFEPEADYGGLPTMDVWTQPLQDIEDQGGWHVAFKLQILWAAKHEVYGLPGTARRRAVQEKVSGWKS